MGEGGATTSVWTASAGVPDFPPFAADREADVCVVGAGIAGLTTAYLLAREGQSVVVLDDGPVGGGETGRTTAHLASALDDGYVRIERLHGAGGARLAAESHAAAIDRIESIVRAESIACGFRRLDGYLFVPPGESTQLLEHERDAARRAGVAVEWAERAPFPRFATGRCLRFARQGQIHPLRYLAALARAIVREGGLVFCGSHADEIEGGDGARVRTAGGFEVRAKAVVVATNTPVNDLFALHTKQASYRSYVVAFPVAAGLMEPALFWDTLDPYHYVRLTEEDSGPVLIVGGEDHKTGQADDADARWARLEAWTRERCEVSGPAIARWSGQVMETIDGLAFIGRNPMDAPNVLVATGDSGMGMTHGTIAGMLLTDLILGRDNPWAALYEPTRKTLRAGVELARQSLNVALQYGDWVTPGDAPSADAVERGAGAVVRRGLHKVAVYRDEDGVVHERSAVCPHLACIVAWNPGEKTWDCPCHGSRFDPVGNVLNGPANADLALLEP